jgi:tRNA threonylcarbamoyl adenosine modification protein (Sua5/YciO/YrdC/YwlC family)
MNTDILTIHSETPEIRKIRNVVDALKSGAVILYPTDTGFTLGCELSNKNAIERIRQIRRLPPNKEMTFLCYSLANIAEFASVSNVAYRMIKRLIPGPYTLILPASRLVPKFAVDMKRKTSGIRVPDNILSQLLLQEMEQPLISISARSHDDDEYADPDDLFDKFAPMVDVAVNSDTYYFQGESTVIDMTTDNFKIIRPGAGITKALEFIDMPED